MNDDAERLRAQVRPDNWRNPEPAALYDLVVIGGGTAGLVCAAGAAGLGARVALVERGLLGGDCLNTGCVPSKTLIRAARAVHEARAARRLGVAMTPEVDFQAVMGTVRARRADLAHHDSAARLASIGVDVFFGDGSFSGSRSVLVADRELRFRRAVVATGTTPSVPSIPGLSAAGYLTSESLFELRAQPRSLLVIGAGPIGCEMAQTFALLGTAVTLIELNHRILPLEDVEASSIIARRLEQDGVRVMVDTSVTDVTRSGDTVTVRMACGPKAQRDDRGERNQEEPGGYDNGTTVEATVDTILVATGRSLHLDGLNLDAAGVTYHAHGVEVDDHLRTANGRIYAAGDVCSRLRFTHAADAMARIVIQNALFHGRRRASALLIPYSTYTCPEVAHVGMTFEAAIKAGGAPITVPLTDVDRAVIDSEADGFLRVHHVRGRVIAATLVASRAGELIGYLASLMRRRGSLSDLSSEIFPYPTLADALRKAGDAYQRTRLTPRVRSVLQRYFALRRRM